MTPRAKRQTFVRWTTVIGIFLPTLCAVVLLCCKKSSSGGSAAGSPYVAEYCALVTQCCPEGGTSVTSQTCNDLGNSALGDAGVDMSAANACITAMKQAQSNQTLCSALSSSISTDILGGTIPQCSAVYTKTAGSVQPGQPCVQDSDCLAASGGSAICLTIQYDTDAGFDASDDAAVVTLMTCVQTTLGEANATPCIGTTTPGGNTYTWSTPPAPSHAVLCDEDGGVACNATTATCASLATIGQPCELDTDCVGSAYCALGDVGADTDAGDAGGEVDGGSFDDAGNPIDLCAPRLPDGSDCTNAPTGCLTTSTCDFVSQLCTPLLPDGSSCSDDSQCLGGACPSGTCTSNPNLGLAAVCSGP